MTDEGFYLSCGILHMNNSFRKDLHPIGPNEFSSLLVTKYFIFVKMR
jgi:hypothetical protein